MSEVLSLSETLEKTILDWCAANGGGFPLGFACIVDFAAESGGNELYIAKQPGQPTHRSMGLASYMNLWFQDDAQRIWAHVGCSECEDDEGDE
jgi:hypothetical protein